LRADLGREPRRAVADEHDVRQAFHHRAGDGDRMEVAGQRSHRADAVRRSVDDRCVELDDAEHVGLPAAANARIGGVGLDHARARLDRIERAAALPQHRDAGRQPGRAVPARDHDRCDRFHLPAAAHSLGVVMPRAGERNTSQE
jgi:hypothetical protein